MEIKKFATEIMKESEHWKWLRNNIGEHPNLGDYPALDRDNQTRLKSRRQAGYSMIWILATLAVLLSGTILWSVGSKLHIGGMVFRWSDGRFMNQFHARTLFMVMNGNQIKNIPIFYSAPNKDRRFFIPAFDHRCNWNSAEGTLPFRMWSKDSGRSVVCTLNENRLPVVNDWESLNIYPRLHVSGGSGSDIFPFHPKNIFLYYIIPEMWSAIKSFTEYKGSLGDRQAFVSYLSTFFGGDRGSIGNATSKSGFAPESLGRACQGDCKNSHDHSGGRSDSFDTNIDSPIINRILVCFLSLLACMGISAIGWLSYQRNRRFIGVFLIGIAFLVGSSGFALLVLAGFRWTWSWWI